MMAKKFFLISLAAAGILLLLPMTTHALWGRTDDDDARSASQRESSSERKRGGAAWWRNDSQLKLCEQRQKVIVDSMSRISDRSTKQFELFTTIAERTKDFYTRKGKVLANYDELVADVNAKKAAVEAVMKNETSFDCKGNNPRDVVKTFNDKLRAKIRALEEYKKAVRNLIIGVKSAQDSNTGRNRGGNN